MPFSWVSKVGSLAELEDEPFIAKEGGTLMIPVHREDRKVKLFFRLSLITNLIFVFVNIFLGGRMTHMKPVFKDEVYSPVNRILKYRNVVFTSGFTAGRTAFMGPPNPEREALWNDLYSFGTSVINREQAAKLVNKTVPVPDKNGEYEGNYVVMLGVFHQLHCVVGFSKIPNSGKTPSDKTYILQNLLRKSLYWTRPWPKAPEEPMGLMHLEHCVDALRQAVMCSADVTPHPWVWEDGQNREVAEVMHTCRDFDAIRDWARPRDVFVRGWNKSIWVPDPLTDP